MSCSATPGGRLPITFGRRAADYPTESEEAFPGIDGVAQYDEDVFVGYRYFDEHGVKPLFPFGHGLSYAAFEYDDVTVTETDDGMDVTVDLRNTTDRAGKEVVQVYIGKSAALIPTPERELVGFEAVSLKSGESTTVSLPLDPEDFAYYDEDEGWTVASGTNTVFVGRSSRDIRVTAEVTV